MFANRVTGRRILVLSCLIPVLGIGAGIGRWLYLREYSRYRSEDVAVSISTNPKATVVELVADLGSRNALDRNQAVEALVDHGSDAVPEVINALRHDDAVVRRGAARVLGRLGPVADSAVPALAESLSDTDQPVVENALLALERIGPASGPAVPKISQLLRHGDGSMRLAAIRALGAIGQSAVPSLSEQLVHSDIVTRTHAALVLTRVDPSALQALPVLCEALNRLNRDTSSQEAARSAFRRFNAAVIPSLVRSLQDERAAVRSGAAIALVEFGPAAVQAVPALTAALEEDDQEVRHNALVALAAIGSGAQPAISRIIAATDDEKEFVRYEAYQSLGKLGAFSSDAVDTLVQRLDGGQVSFAHTRFALGAIHLTGPNGKAAIPILKELVGHHDRLTRLQAARGLWKIDQDVETALPVLREALKDQHPESDSLDLALEVLGEMGPRAAPALPELRLLVKPKPSPGFEARISSAAAKLAKQIDADAAAKLGIR